MINEEFEEIVDNMLKKEKRDIKSRQKYNKKIIEAISYMTEKHPDLRFGQILTISGIIDKEIDLFNEESKFTSKRLEKTLKKLDI